MSVNPGDLSQYESKQVLLTYVKDGETDASQAEGKIEAASEAGIAFKEKGKREVELIMPAAVEEIELAPVKPKKLAQKKLKLVTESTVRQHLLDRHGYERSVVNGMDDEKALAEHEDIDHADLGHKHEADDEDESTEAGDEGAATEADDDSGEY